MKTIYVDDESWMIKRFCMECEEIEGMELIGTFDDPMKALDFAATHEVNCAFLDISMPIMDGLQMSDHLRSLQPEIIIIYVSAHDEYMVEAFKNKKADYYILKPYSREEISSAIDRAKLLSARQRKSIYIETFGNFNVYINGKFLKFKSKVAKEIFALLVDKNGTSLTNKEAFFYMWEDLAYTHENMARVRKGILMLRKILAEENISDVLISSRSQHRLNTSMVDCDYYDFLEGKAEAINKYKGEYMLEYSWAEETNAALYDSYMKRKG